MKHSFEWTAVDVTSHTVTEKEMFNVIFTTNPFMIKHVAPVYKGSGTITPPGGVR